MTKGTNVKFLHMFIHLQYYPRVISYKAEWLQQFLCYTQYLYTTGISRYSALFWWVTCQNMLNIVTPIL